MRRRSWLPLVALCLLLAMAGCDPNKVIPSEVRTESASDSTQPVAAGRFEGTQIASSGDWDLVFADESTGPYRTCEVVMEQNGAEIRTFLLAPGGVIDPPFQVASGRFGLSTQWRARQRLLDADNRIIVEKVWPLQVRR